MGRATILEVPPDLFGVAGVPFGAPILKYHVKFLVSLLAKTQPIVLFRRRDNFQTTIELTGSPANW